MHRDHQRPAVSRLCRHAATSKGSCGPWSTTVFDFKFAAERLMRSATPCRPPRRFLASTRSKVTRSGACGPSRVWSVDPEAVAEDPDELRAGRLGVGWSMSRRTTVSPETFAVPIAAPSRLAGDDRTAARRCLAGQVAIQVDLRTEARPIGRPRPSRGRASTLRPRPLSTAADLDHQSGPGCRATGPARA